MVYLNPLQDSFQSMRNSLVLIASCLVLCLTITLFGCGRPTDASNNTRAESSRSTSEKIAVISLTSDPQTDPQSVNMGLTFAGFCMDEGYDVAIFFNVKGTKLATKEFPSDFKYLEHDPLATQLKQLKERGVELHVCPVCMKDLDISDASIIESAFVTSKPKLFSKLGSDTMVFTY